MFFDLNNCTISSVDDKGDLYYASFDFFPKVKGHSHYVYKGMLFGRGVKNNKKCAVKFMRDRFADDPEQWQTRINSAKAAKKIAEMFNHHILSKRDLKLKFRVPFTSMMDTVASSYTFLRLMANFVGKNAVEYKPDRNEYALVEEYIRGDFSMLTANNGWMSANPSYRELQAFAHFSWCYSGGELVVAEVKGVQTSTQYLLTSPVLKSRSEVFGNRDNGQSGIDEFFQAHCCNDICANWSKPLTADPNVFTSWPVHDKLNENVPMVRHVHWATEPAKISS